MHAGPYIEEFSGRGNNWRSTGKNSSSYWILIINCLTEGKRRRPSPRTFQSTILLSRTSHTEETSNLYFDFVYFQTNYEQDSAIEEIELDGKFVKTGKIVTRLCLVLDCYTPHDFAPTYARLTNLQYYVLKEKRLCEVEAVRIFHKVVQIVERLHKVLKIHLKLQQPNFVSIYLTKINSLFQIVNMNNC
jgi:hypothetical protein